MINTQSIAIAVIILITYSATTHTASALLLSTNHHNCRNINYFPSVQSQSWLPHRHRVVHNNLLYHGKIKSSMHECIGIVDEKFTGMDNAISNEEMPSDASNLNNKNTSQRRNVIISLSTIFLTTLTTKQQSATAIDNPLNLKGTFWETGKLYEKSNILPEGDDDFFSILENTVEALQSPELTEAITTGKYGQTSRLLRGGLVSESKLRLAAYALIDEIPEDDEAIYRANEAFRVFLRYLDVLDAEVEAASRPTSALGLGGGGGLGESSDPRMKILTRLGDVENSLKVFLKIVKGGGNGN